MKLQVVDELESGMPMETVKNDKGFSLIELIIVVGIMAVLIAIIAPNLTKYLGSAKAQTDETNKDQIAAIMYRACGQVGTRVYDVTHDTWIELKDGSEIYNSSEKREDASGMQTFAGFVATEMASIPKSKVTGENFQVKISEDADGKYLVEVK